MVFIVFSNVSGSVYATFIGFPNVSPVSGADNVVTANKINDFQTIPYGWCHASRYFEKLGFTVLFVCSKAFCL